MKKIFKAGLAIAAVCGVAYATKKCIDKHNAKNPDTVKADANTKEKIHNITENVKKKITEIREKNFATSSSETVVENTATESDVEIDANAVTDDDTCEFCDCCDCCCDCCDDESDKYGDDTEVVSDVEPITNSPVVEESVVDEPTVAESVVEPVEEKLTEEEFIEKYCHNCGTQRCEGPGTEWFEGCQNKDRLTTSEE